jgi:hypothetical protein
MYHEATPRRTVRLNDALWQAVGERARRDGVMSTAVLTSALGAWLRSPASDRAPVAEPARKRGQSRVDHRPGTNRLMAWPTDCEHKHALAGWCRECRTGGHFPAAQAQGNMKGTT